MTRKKTQPHYTHTCDACRYLGTVRLRQTSSPTDQKPDHVYDVYRCKGSASVLGDTILARYGNDAPAYWSMDAGVFASAILAPKDCTLSEPERAAVIGVMFGSYPAEVR